MLINDAWKIEGLFGKIKKKKKENKNLKAFSGSKKYFESECQKVMKSINIKYLMSHDTGIVQHYYKPTLESELLDNYLL